MGVCSGRNGCSGIPAGTGIPVFRHPAVPRFTTSHKKQRFSSILRRSCKQTLDTIQYFLAISKVYRTKKSKIYIQLLNYILQTYAKAANKRIIGSKAF